MNIDDTPQQRACHPVSLDSYHGKTHAQIPEWDDTVSNTENKDDIDWLPACPPLDSYAFTISREESHNAMFRVSLVVSPGCCFLRPKNTLYGSSRTSVSVLPEGLLQALLQGMPRPVPREP